MTALGARLRPRLDSAAGGLAALTGAAVRQVGRGLPGVAGPLLICYGLWQAWTPLGFIVAGGFLLLVDRRVP